MAGFDPINPMMALLVGTYTSDVVRETLYNTGVAADFNLNEKENYSHSTRSRAYDQRFRQAYEQLNDNDKYRAAYIIAEQLVGRDGANEVKLNAILNKIGWRIQNGKLTPIASEVAEKFFPPGSEYDAYSAIKSMINQAQAAIFLQDNHIDGTLFQMLSSLGKENITIQVLTAHVHGGDFSLEGKNFMKQFPNLSIEIRTTADFHDRFIILDGGQRCFHIGASIKDAGKKAFMTSEVEDQANRDALVNQAKQSWASGTVYKI